MRVTTHVLLQGALRTAACGGRVAPSQGVGGHAKRATLEVRHG